MEKQSITDVFAAVPDADYPVRLSKETMGFAQDDKFIRLAAIKNLRLEQLKQHFKGRAPKRVFIGQNLNGFDFTLPGCEVVQLELSFFKDTDENVRAQRRALLDDSIVVVTNNDVCHAGRLFGDYYNQCPNTIFVVWDWDNHHWLAISTYAAAHCDVYAPAHHENLYLMTRYNWNTVGPVYCATIQWSREFLAGHVTTMVNAQRSDEPLGMHFAYDPFVFRNRVTSTLSQHFPTIGFSNNNFHDRSKEDRLIEWCSHKAHWIIPVLNDVPIRLFDALVTGGIPIVPSSMEHLPLVRDISREHILFYTPHDIINPTHIVARAVEMFNRGGVDKLVERHRYALDHHQGDGRVRSLLGYVSDIFGTVLPLR